MMINSKVFPLLALLLSSFACPTKAEHTGQNDIVDDIDAIAFGASGPDPFDVCNGAFQSISGIDIDANGTVTWFGVVHTCPADGFRLAYNFGYNYTLTDVNGCFRGDSGCDDVGQTTLLYDETGEASSCIAGTCSSCSPCETASGEDGVLVDCDNVDAEYSTDICTPFIDFLFGKQFPFCKICRTTCAEAAFQCRNSCRQQFRSGKLTQSEARECVKQCRSAWEECKVTCFDGCQ